MEEAPEELGVDVSQDPIESVSPEEHQVTKVVEVITPAFRSNWSVNLVQPSFEPHAFIRVPEREIIIEEEEEEDVPWWEHGDNEFFEEVEESSEDEFSDTASVMSVNSVTSLGSKFGKGTKKTPAFLLATGRPRVCNACMVGIYCEDLPFPDGTKPKRRVIRKLEKQESAKAKLEVKQQKKSNTKENPVAPSQPATEQEKNPDVPVKQDSMEDMAVNSPQQVAATVAPDFDMDTVIEMQISEKINIEIAERDRLRLELEECDGVDAERVAKLVSALEDKEYEIQVLFSALGLENQSTEVNPLLRRKDYKQKTRRVNIVKGTLITTGTTAAGTVGGAVVGSATGFLLGFGAPGAVAGAVTGAVVGGVSGAFVGGYISKLQSEQRPNRCVNCKLKMKKNKPGFMPYQCRSCWLWFCDRCVPHELILESKSFHTVTYQNRDEIDKEIELQQQEEEFEYTPTQRQLVKVKKRKKGSKIADVDQVSKASTEKEGHCSWCFKKTVHILVSKAKLTRNIWQCQGCVQRTLICRNPRCHEMARGLVGYDEEGCWKCQGKISSWKTAVTEAEAKQRNGYCSWCFEITQHDPMCHTAMIRVFKCRLCRNTTVPCSSCPKGDGWGMARDNGFFWKGKCALHAKHIESWQDPQHNRDISELKDRWCPRCVEKTTHTIMGPKGLVDRRTSLLCKNCHQQTFHCSEDCTEGVSKHARSKCLPCKFRIRKEKEQKKEEKTGTPGRKIDPNAPRNFKELIEKKEIIYATQSSIDFRVQDLGRESENREREKANKKGYLRPFLLLVSMEPQMRVLTAATLNIDLIVRPSFGDAHAEAWEIIGHKKKGLIFRTRKASEEISKIVGTRATWYTTLRRAMRASVKATTFKNINAKVTKDSCRNPDLNVLPEMELEFIEKLAHWQHVMLSPEVSEIADNVVNNPEIEEHLASLERFGLATPTIKRFLAESFAEASLTTPEQHSDMLTEFLESIEENENQQAKDNVSVASSILTTAARSHASTVHTFKSDCMSVGIGSTYSQKADLVRYTAASIPAAYVKMTVWFFVGAALAVWLGPVGWALEWGASLALGTVITSWIAGEIYLGPSHEVMTPAVVLICMQRLTLAGEGVDIAEFM